MLYYFRYCLYYYLWVVSILYQLKIKTVTAFFNPCKSWHYGKYPEISFFLCFSPFFSVFALNCPIYGTDKALQKLLFTVKTCDLLRNKCQLAGQYLQYIRTLCKNSAGYPLPVLSGLYILPYMLKGLYLPCIAFNCWYGVFTRFNCLSSIIGDFWLAVVCVVWFAVLLSLSNSRITRNFHLCWLFVVLGVFLCGCVAFVRSVAKFKPLTVALGLCLVRLVVLWSRLRARLPPLVLADPLAIPSAVANFCHPIPYKIFMCVGAVLQD